MNLFTFKIKGKQDTPRNIPRSQITSLEQAVDNMIERGLGEHILEKKYPGVYSLPNRAMWESVLNDIVEQARQKLHADSSFTVLVKHYWEDLTLVVYQNEEQRKREADLIKSDKNAPFEYWMQ